MKKEKFNDFMGINGMNCCASTPKTERDNENGVLFALVYFLIVKEKKLISEFEISELKKYMDNVVSNLNAGLPRGLYNRGMGEDFIQKGFNRTISHDNMTAIACIDSKFAKDIYNYGIKKFFCYNNVYPYNFKFSRVLHPRDIILYSYLGGGFFGKAVATIFLPFFYMTQFLILMNTEEVRPMWYDRLFSKIKKAMTGKDDGKSQIKERNKGESGKQLLYVRITSLVEANAPFAKIFWRFSNYRIKKIFGNWNQVFINYYTKWGVQCDPILDACGFFTKK